MSGNSIYNIDFEYWSVLASTDPQKFEQLRQNQITAIIERASSQRQRRLRGLQWRIDIIREQHKDSAIAACRAISELMWETFEQLAELLQQSTTECGSSAPIPPMQANIILFPSKSRS